MISKTPKRNGACLANSKAQDRSVDLLGPRANQGNRNSLVRNVHSFSRVQVAMCDVDALVPPLEVKYPIAADHNPSDMSGDRLTCPLVSLRWNTFQSEWLFVLSCLMSGEISSSQNILYHPWLLHFAVVTYFRGRRRPTAAVKRRRVACP